MKIKKVLLASALSLTALPAIAAVSPGTASAACDYREICFYQDDNGGGGVWETQSRASSHTNIFGSNGYTVRNNVDSVRNRDSSCDIKVVDDRGINPDDVDTVPNDGLMKNLKSSVDNENDRHEKGSC